ncbi:hypothetical protein N9L19_00675 [bacterium]|nr:hypothetical protein [bacterium]
MQATHCRAIIGLSNEWRPTRTFDWDRFSLNVSQRHRWVLQCNLRGWVSCGGMRVRAPAHNDENHFGVLSDACGDAPVLNGLDSHAVERTLVATAVVTHEVLLYRANSAFDLVVLNASNVLLLVGDLLSALVCVIAFPVAVIACALLPFSGATFTLAFALDLALDTKEMWPILVLAFPHLTTANVPALGLRMPKLPALRTWSRSVHCGNVHVAPPSIILIELLR